MDPRWRASATSSLRLPRTRGDGPEGGVLYNALVAASPHTRGWTLATDWRRHRRRGFPAHAGMDPAPTCLLRTRWWLPRTRGDGPQNSATRSPLPSASPHTRGWTCSIPIRPTPAAGFPAHAGMDPVATRGYEYRTRLPRTRGDGPCASSVYGTVRWASPAHAGMDPSTALMRRAAPPAKDRNQYRRRSSARCSCRVSDRTA